MFRSISIFLTVCLGLAAAAPGYPVPFKKGHGYESGYDRKGDNYRPGYKGGYVDNYGHGKYYKKYECKVNSDCIKGYICSDNFCVPDCGPCSEFDFTTGYCKYLCAKSAKCVPSGKYNYSCFCPYCPGMDGYDKYANCKPPKYLKGICYSYDKRTKAYLPKKGHGYQYNYDGKKPYYNDNYKDY